jgi:hypothetical protein
MDREKRMAIGIGVAVALIWIAPPPHAVVIGAVMGLAAGFGYYRVRKGRA